GFDLIHYCGHLVASAGANPALLLAEEQTLSAAAIEANVAGRPLVFLNACASARGEGRPGESAWEATASSVVHGFLFGGAVAVVGTLCEVADRHAAALAAAFYRGALERLPIGEALRAARAECRAEPESASSPTWLSVVLYGNPAQVLLPGQVEEREPALSVVPAPAPVPRRATRPALRWAALVVLVLGLVAGMVYLRLQPPQPLVVGVMEVRSRGNETLDAYRLLRDTLGEPVKKREAPKPPRPGERAPGTSWFEGRGLAYAGEREGDDAAIHALLRQYAAALEAKRVDQLAGLQV